jgi:hypothetical protein
MSTRALIVDWKGLKKMGWPYSRAHTRRMMFDPDYRRSVSAVTQVREACPHGYRGGECRTTFAAPHRV